MHIQENIQSGAHRPFEITGTRLVESDGYFVGKFSAMACPCEILIDTDNEEDAWGLFQTGVDEAMRIERKLSRYVKGNIIDRINSSDGAVVGVDEETARLLDFSAQCHRLSGGLFDVTSGVLRKAWKFDGSDRIPNENDVQSLLPFVGWEKVDWKSPNIRLLPGMQIDLGGVGKEYAVDRALDAIREHSDRAVLVNFGGDIAARGKKRNGLPWVAGVERPDRENQASRVIHLANGAVATSGDAKKFLMKDGRRYGHILDPRTGWPVVGAPRSITVVAQTCSEAGFLTTFGMLSGENARNVLDKTGVKYWCDY